MAGSSGSEVIRCPDCRASITVPPEWRLVQCPSCGHAILRMEGDQSFD
jgi:predicted Zn finger-like uncharacterized protein